jgi:glycosyltransferase involved in cell wall biosynthesis
MIVVLINNLGVGGAERLVVDDSNELFRRGIEMRLILLSKTPQSNLEHDLLIPPEWIIRYPVHSIFDIKNIIGLSSIFRDLKAIRVITHLWFANTIGRLAAFMAQVNVVIAFEHNVYDTVKTKKQFIIDWILQYCSTYIVAVSEAVRQSLLAHHIKDRKIRVIPNALPLAKYQSATPTSLQEYTKNREETVFIFIGRLIHQKAVDVLIQAFQDVERAHLLIVGDGPLRETLMAQAQNLKIADRISFLGIRKDIPGLLAASNVFVLPSRFEGFGIVGIEAMATGLPLVLSDFEAAKTFATPGENAIIVQRDDVTALAEAMISLRDNPQDRERLGTAGKKRAELFSITHHIDQLI